MSDFKDYYGGDKAMQIIEEMGHGYGFCIGSAIKYLYRAGKKSGNTLEQDLEKAIWFIERVIKEKKTESPPEIHERPVVCRVDVESDGSAIHFRKAKNS